MPYDLPIDLYRFDELSLGHALFQRVRYVNGPRPDEERFAPLARERRDVGGVRHHGSGNAVHRIQQHRWDFDDLAQFGAAVHGAFESGFGSGGVAHQPDHDIGLGFIGDHVGRAPAGERPDVERAGPQKRVDGKDDAPDFGQRIDQFVDGRIAQLRIRRVRHLPAGGHFVPQRAFGTERQFVFGGLAVDNVFRPARVSRSVIGSGAVAFLAHHQQQAETALSGFEQTFDRLNHGGDDAFGVAGAAPPDEFLVF